jgi:hypothetical protein
MFIMFIINYKLQFISFCYCKAWIPVTTAWRVLRLQLEEQPPVWRVAVNKLNKPTRGGPPSWGLGEVLTTPSCENVPVMNYSQ